MGRKNKGRRGGRKVSGREERRRREESRGGREVGGKGKQRGREEEERKEGKY